MIFNLVFKICFSQFSWIVIPNQYKWSSLSKIKNKWSSSKLGPSWIHNKLYENVYSRPFIKNKWSSSKLGPYWVTINYTKMFSLGPSLAIGWFLLLVICYLQPKSMSPPFSLSLSLSLKGEVVYHMREKICIRCMLYFLLKGIGRDLTVQSPP